MSGYLKSIGMVNINFLTIVGKDSKEKVDSFKELTTTMKVFEDNAEKELFTSLGGKLNDIFVFDTCGRLAYYIRFPLSIINARQRAAESAIVSTYTTEICGPPCKILEELEVEKQSEVKEESQELQKNSDSEELEEKDQQDSGTSSFTQSIWKVWSYVKKIFTSENIDKQDKDKDR